MRRFLMLTSALILISVSAFAESLENTVFAHNMNTSICNALEITGTPRVTEKSTGTNYEYILTDNLRAIFIEKDSKVNSCAFVCFDESDAAEFLAQCITACYNFGGIEAGTECYDPILFNFMSARSGTNLDSVTLPGLLFKISKEQFGYTFTLVRID